MTAASGINQTGRCRSTVILLAFGRYPYPGVKVAMEATSAFLDLWATSAAPKWQLWAACWHIASKVISDNGGSSGTRSRALGKAIATISTFGWNLRFYEVWATAGSSTRKRGGRTFCRRSGRLLRRLSGPARVDGWHRRGGDTGLAQALN